jgi:hypothetical protein
MKENKISYITRDFQQIRTELINFTRSHYPDVVNNFNDEWVLFLDEFRKTDSYRKSNGQLLFPKFFEWLSSNYEIPKKKLL